LIATTEGVSREVFVSIDGIYSAAGECADRRLSRQTRLLFNGDVISELDGAQSLDNPQFSRITINGEQVPTYFSKWKFVRDTCAITSLIAERIRHRHDRDTRRQVFLRHVPN